MRREHNAMRLEMFALDNDYTVGQPATPPQISDPGTRAMALALDADLYIGLLIGHRLGGLAPCPRHRLMDWLVLNPLQRRRSMKTEDLHRFEKGSITPSRDIHSLIHTDNTISPQCPLRDFPREESSM